MSAPRHLEDSRSPEVGVILYFSGEETDGPQVSYAVKLGFDPSS